MVRSLALKPHVVAVAAAVALTACSGSKAPDSTSNASANASAGPAAAASPVSPAGIPNACDVLTLDIAKAAIGAAATMTRKAQPNPHMTQCVYTGKTGSAAAMVGEWNFIKSMVFSDAKPVQGIGDEAYHTGGHLVVRKGDSGFQIVAFGQAGEFTGAAADNVTAADDALEAKIAKMMLAKL